MSAIALHDKAWSPICGRHRDRTSADSGFSHHRNSACGLVVLCHDRRVGGVLGRSIDSQYRLRGPACDGNGKKLVAGRLGRRDSDRCIPVGATFGARRKPISPIWSRALGSVSPAKRYSVAFIAGFLMLLGARIADGCTSGHGLSGTAQLAVGSIVAVVAMFAGGIGTALLALRRI